LAKGPTKTPKPKPQEPEDQGKASPSEAKRDLPEKAGLSYAATVAMPHNTSTKPVFVKDNITVTRGVIPNKRALCKLDQAQVDIDLYYHLLSEFGFVPRTAETLRNMHVSVKRHMKKFDVSSYSPQELYMMEMRAVETAFPIPKEEQRIRASLKNQTVLSELDKHSKFVKDGNVGNVGEVDFGFGKMAGWLKPKTSRKLPAAKS
jgi:hypothetical protein